jgi:FMN hydrolase / 5-amino-6-(5-phospho-D-ribitylamino)uracil phosphatase
VRELRDQVLRQQPELRHDLSAVRKEAIRMALIHAGDNPNLAEAAFDVFYEARNQVVLFDDALPALMRISARYPVVALSNGSADLRRIGLAEFFKDSISAKHLGFGKPKPEAFLAAAQALGLPPHQVLHVGDDLQLDIQGALATGMQAAWVNREPADDVQLGGSVARVSDLLELCTLLGV